jgi:hypothetical protein
MRDHFGTIGRAAHLAMAILFAAASSGAAKIEGVEFDERVTVGDRVRALRSLGLLRYRIFFKGYVAALYLEPAADLENVLIRPGRREPSPSASS